jgi:hypothetical protein
MLLKFIVILLRVAARGVCRAFRRFRKSRQQILGGVLFAAARLSPAQNGELLEERIINSNHADVRRA